MGDTATQVAEQQFQWLSQLPWLVLIVCALPVVVAAWRLKIYPTRWWIVLLSVSVIASLISVFNPSFVVVVGIIDCLILIVAVNDFLLVYLATNRGIEVSRNIARTCSLGVPIPSEITIENRTSLTLIGAARDDLPDNFQATPPEHALRLPPLGRMTAQRKLTPGRRGAFTLEYIYLRFTSPLKLWTRHLRFEIAQPAECLSRHETISRLRAAGPDQSAQLDRRAADAPNRPGQ